MYYEEHGDIIENIILSLGANYDSDEDIEVISQIFEDTLQIAKSFSNIKENEEKKLYPLVKNATISKYLLRGSEGKSSESVGGINYNFLDIEEKLRQDIIKNGLRRIF